MMTRSTFLKQLRPWPLAAVAWHWPGAPVAGETAEAAAGLKLAALEQRHGTRLGVQAVNLANGALVQHRAAERFPLCSTFKVVLAGAVLRRSVTEPGLMERRLSIAPADLVSWSPITEKHAGATLTVTSLCAAALQHSDNTAANVLMRMLGGPEAVTAYARTLGDKTFRLDRWETALNAALPDDPRDTSTPEAMAGTLQKLVVGDGLPVAQRETLAAWLQGNTTGGKRIRAAVPEGWWVGDKTGSGDYGVANDIAVLWPPGQGAPVVLAIYTHHHDPKAAWDNDLIVAATRTVLEGFGVAAR